MNSMCRPFMLCTNPGPSNRSSRQTSGTYRKARECSACGLRGSLAWSTTVVIHFERTTETPVRCNVVLILNPFAAERRHPFVPAEDVLINKALRGVVAYL